MTNSVTFGRMRNADTDEQRISVFVDGVHVGDLFRLYGNRNWEGDSQLEESAGEMISGTPLREAKRELRNRLNSAQTGTSTSALWEAVISTQNALLDAEEVYANTVYGDPARAAAHDRYYAALDAHNAARRAAAVRGLP